MFETIQSIKKTFLEKSIRYLRVVISFGLLVLLGACASNPQEKTPPVSPYTFVDSTVYFAEQTASLSMRTTFHKGQSAVIAEGYRFQFRTISPTPVFLSSISLIAGGKRLFLEEGQVVLPNEKGVTLKLSIKDSQFVAGFPSALIQFKHNNQSFIFTIELHQVKDFNP